MKSFNPNNYILMNRLVEFNTSTLSKQFADFISKIIKDFIFPQKVRFHDLRHTNATLMIMSNVPSIEVQRRLGHASITTSYNLYGHTYDSLETETSNMLDDKISSILGKKDKNEE